MAIISSKEDLRNCSPSKLLRKKKCPIINFDQCTQRTKIKEKATFGTRKEMKKIIKKNVKMMLKTVDKNRRKEYTKTQKLGK